MKYYGIVLACVFAFVSAPAPVFADEPKVEITSFVYVNNAGRVAEICGKVTGVNAASLARVLVDVNTSNPGVYNVMVGKDGQFCTVVASYRGSASVSLEYLGKTYESAVATVRLLSGR